MFSESRIEPHIEYRNYEEGFSTLKSPRHTQALNCPEGIIFLKTTVGSMDNNVYLILAPVNLDSANPIHNPSSAGTPIRYHALLIDAADDVEYLYALTRSLGAEITDILTTHRHEDHVRALRLLQEMTHARHHAPRYDADALPCLAHRLYGSDTGEYQPLDLASPILSSLGLRVVELRGHTPGGLALRWDSTRRIITGDSLFPGGIGKTETPEDFRQLSADVLERIFDILPGDYVIHPGHGDDSSLSSEESTIRTAFSLR